MKKKILSAVVAVVLVVVSFTAGFFIRNWTNPDLASLDFISREYKKHYIDEKDDYLSTMAKSVLDPYSRYYTKKEYDELKQSNKGIRAGIGVTFLVENAEVYSVNGNSPAEKAGITKGGIIVGVKTGSDTEYTAVTNYNEVSDKLDKVAANVKFSLKIRYGEEDKEFTLAKEEYRETYVFYEDNSSSYRFNDENGKNMAMVRYGNGNSALDENTAYLKYTSFNGLEKGLNGSAGQFAEALKKFKETKKKNLILDLRSNGGGFMDILTSVAAHLMGVENGSKKVVSKTIDKDGNVTNFVSEKVDYADYGFEKIIVLGDDGTASASEALIGAMLDYDEKGIVSVVLSGYKDKSGEIIYRTYGKGIMQTTYENPTTGEAIRLTTAKIYWPTSGITIHGVGVTKDIEKYSARVFTPTIEAGVDYEFNYAVGLISGQ